MRTLLVASVVLLSLGACSSAEEARHEPLVCDASRADEIAFVFHRSDGFEAAPYLPHGYSLLVIDGSCRYFVAGGQPGGVVRTGELTSDELAALNDDILTAPFRALDGTELNYGTGSDSWELTLRRSSYEAHCYDSCAGDDTLVALSVSSFSWIEMLWERGSPLSGPVDVTRSSEPPSRAPIAWEGDTDLAAGMTPGVSTVRVDDAEDVALLRALRASHAVSFGAPLVVQVGDVSLSIGVADVIPLDLELVRVRGDRPW